MFFPSRARLASRRPPMRRGRNLENSAVPTLLVRGSRLAFHATMCRAAGDLEACWNRILTIFAPYTFSRSQGHLETKPRTPPVPRMVEMIRKQTHNQLQTKYWELTHFPSPPSAAAPAVSNWHGAPASRPYSSTQGRTTPDRSARSALRHLLAAARVRLRRTSRPSARAQGRRVSPSTLRAPSCRPCRRRIGTTVPGSRVKSRSLTSFSSKHAGSLRSPRSAIANSSL